MVLLNVCENVAALKILLFFKSLLKIIFIMGPILVIIFSAVSFFKVVMSGDAKDFNKSFIILLKRLIACAAIFFLPTIVNVIINDLLESDNNIMICIENANPEKIKYYEKQQKAKLREKLKNQETKKDSKKEIDEKNNSSSSNDNENNKTTKKLKHLIAIDNSHYNYAKIETNLTGNITWKSNNNKIATVKNGVVTAKKNADGETLIIASNGVESEQFRVVVISQRSSNFKKDKNDYSDEVKEAYINNAEALCHSKNLSKFPECKKATIPIYTGDYTSAVRFAKTATKREIKKKVGISATNYLIFVSSKKQTLTLLEKVNDEWKVKYSFISSTGRDFSVKGDYSFAFYAGVIEYDSNPAVKKCGSTAINQFKQGKKKGGLRIKEKNIREPAITGRWIHYSSALGYPSSAGCNHLSCKDYVTIRDIIKDNLGTRIIVF
ncbi:MAG: hypothetical protein IKQ35_00505 [Bacilli bacterium]|nr:hypothetical protein [Bacilli bacterium]